MPTSELVLALERRLRALGNDDPIFIANTIQLLINKTKNKSLEEGMEEFEILMDSIIRLDLNLSSEKFPNLVYEGVVLGEFKNHPKFNFIAETLKDQFSSRGKGFGKMVPRPIDFGRLSKLAEEKIDKTTLFFTILFWTAIYSIILYYV
ncbi:MAG: hypothetical protein O9346_15355 [Leptospiraceae bacterium]|nr:hypothetical protein [Leptospiraceae bacterium]MCZ8347793.1 hypothetical protein [Leptospiraceae bacterium]PJE04547.1 MAG: hypothetical protein CK427_01855 [Leptospira sp.]